MLVHVIIFYAFIQVVTRQSYELTVLETGYEKI